MTAEHPDHPPQDSAPSHWRLRQRTWADAVLAVALVAAAFVVRWPFLARGATLLHSDEAVVGIMAQDIAEGRNFPVFFYGQRYMGALEAYVIAGLQRWVGADPLLALRLAPTGFFALLVAVQYLMLTRWFGRLGGLAGACVLLAGPPMLVQWSIAARGGYVEVLLWGSLLWWCYGEWFVPRPGASEASLASPLRKVVFGALLGSGFWINPSIVVFLAPVVVHALLNRPLAAARADSSLGPWLARLDRLTLGLPLALPLMGLSALFAVSALCSVRVDEGKVHYTILFDLVPAPLALSILAPVGLALFFLVRRSALMGQARLALRASGPLVLGLVAGLAPVLWYPLQRRLAGLPLEDSLPLGPRPPWTVGEGLTYIWSGLGTFFGTSSGPLLAFLRLGRPYDLAALPAGVTALLSALDWLVAGALCTVGVVLVRTRGRELAQALRLRPGLYGPAVLLVLAGCGLLVLYLMGGCTTSFLTIRYLMPLWAILPGLVAATVTAAGRRPALLARAAFVGLLLAWGIGQVGFVAQLGAPHPLQPVAQQLQRQPQEAVSAELFDAHLLTFLTRQQPPVVEFCSYWPRLLHLRPQPTPGKPALYLVQAEDRDWTADWRRGGWPGPPSPELIKVLRPALLRVLAETPDAVLAREPLGGGYELWTLRSPLAEGGK